MQRVKLLRKGLSPSVIDEMNFFDQLDFLEISPVDDYFENQQLAKLLANELSTVLAPMFKRMMPRRRR